jgi:predicted RNase H-like HicB family nuclease
MTPAEYLKLTYGRTIYYEDDGSFRAEIIDLPGCIAVGDTVLEALANLECVAESWIEAALDLGQVIPYPKTSKEFRNYSGKSLHEEKERP